MRRYLLLSICFCFSLLTSLTAQDNYLKDYAPVAPTPASLGKYGDIPVGYHTGVPDISIPIYTFTEGAISVPVSLSCHTAGIRVQETASWVGLGWALNAGGVITRTVQGAPDELANFNQLWGWYKNKGNPRAVGTCPPLVDIASGKYDTEPDIFNFNVGGYTGKFFYNKDTIIQIVPQQDIQIKTVNIGGQLFSGWILIDPQGNRYHFGATNPSMVFNDYVEKCQYTLDPAEPTKNTSWYLSKIESADGKDVIQFTYIQEKYAYWEVSSSPRGNGIHNISAGPCDADSTVQPLMRARVIGKRLSSITGTNGSVAFIGDAALRQDLSNYDYVPAYANTEAKALKTIEIRDKANTCLRKFEFAYTYSSLAPIGSLTTLLIPTYGDPADRQRLILTSLSEQECGSTTNSKTHTFEYYDQNSLPRRISFAQDHWGYYNGKTSNLTPNPGFPYFKTFCHTCESNYAHHCTTLPDYREPSFPNMRNGTLKKITYPAGGSSTFDYEANTTWATDTVCTEANIDNPWNASGGSCSSAAFNTRTYTFTSTQISNGHIELKWSNPFCTTSGTATLQVYLGPTATGSPIAFITASATSPSSATTYSWLKKVGGVTLSAGVQYTFKLSTTNGIADIKLYTLIRALASANKIVGGLRIKTITTADGLTANNIVKNYEYPDPIDPTHSSGKLIQKPTYMALFEIPCSGASCIDTTTTGCDSLLTNANHYTSCPTNLNLPLLWAVAFDIGNQPMQTTMGSHIGYNKVVVKQTGNGKSEYRYNMGIYNTSPYVPTGYPFAPPPYEPTLGTLSSETHYTESGVAVSFTQYQYLTNNVYVVSGYDANKVYIGLNGNPFTSQYYGLNTGYALQNQITSVEYFSDGSSVQKITAIGYSTANGHLQKTTEDVTDADGSIYRTKFKYARDYPCPSSCAPNVCDETCSGANPEGKAILAMRKRNMIAIPIEQTSWLKRPSWGAFQLTGATYFQFDKVNTDYNNIKLKAVYQVRPASPMTTFVESYTNTVTGYFNRDGNYTQEYNFTFSDTHGKILAQWKQNDPAKQQYIWSHNNKLPIAKIINAEDTEVAYTSFEQNDIAYQGYWTFSGSLGGWSTISGDFVTGRTGFNLSPARTIARNSLPAGKYIVSGWHKDGSFVVNGTTVSTSTGGQWKYAEKEITLASPGNITVSSGASDWSQIIDELRLYPSDALMRTFSYDDRSQLLLSIADENNVAAHFDYDNFQRLQAVRDQDRNIVQTYEYNYQQAGTALNDIKARTVLISGQTTVSAVNSLVSSSVRRVFQFMDGLGRPIQTNEVGQSPVANDIITMQEYDMYGREPKKYLPYTITTNSGVYRTGAAAEQLSFANTFGAGGYGYSETRYEPSPVNRILEQSAPGATWRIGLSHTIEYLYRSNTAADVVHDFTNSNSFPVNSLYVLEETDENDRKKWTFTDKIGRAILVKQELNATEISQTYTVYDDYGRLLCVIPPETTKRMIASSNWDYNNASYVSMIFKYTYDSRGRMTGKTVPSGGTTLIAYDRLDRPVLTTDANGFKTYTRYDILSRTVMSGKYKGSGSPGVADPLYETPNTTSPHFYTSASFPSDNNLDVYSVFYFDDYDLDNNGSIGSGETYTDPAESGYETAAFLRTRGKPTAAKVGILLNSGLTPTTFLTTRTYYDKEYSVIQINKQNHLGGSDISSNAYDFANRVTKSRRDHTATPPGGTLKTYTVREEYVFDHAGRIRFTRHKINSNNWVLTTAPVYDELNRVQDKRLHASNYDGVSTITLKSVFTYLQSLDYTYNIRGWLTGINDPTSCSIQAGDDLVDLFRMQLTYESTANGGTAQYNGNINTMQWNTHINGTCGVQQLYRFNYDMANRLTSADHRTWNGSSWTDPVQYNESGITYDLNGNLKTYTRKGLVTAPTTFGTIDQLTYTYGDALRPDRLTQMSDAGNATKGFVYTAAAAAYQYDNNGNMTQDNHKGFVIAYNYLNLPQTFTKGANVITMTYTADGEKLTKAVTGGGATRNYLSGIEYAGANLDAIYFSEGRCTPNGATTFYYDYTIKDHLGNARVNFRANGAAVTFLEDFHYYPFGLLMEGIGTVAGTSNNYQYNMKEFNNDFGINLLDYGARWYDAALGRWWSVDLMTEGSAPISTYSYVMNNPISLIDPTGMIGVTYGAGGYSSAGEWGEAKQEQHEAWVHEQEIKRERKRNVYVLIRSTEEIGQFFANSSADLGTFHIFIATSISKAEDQVIEYMGDTKLSTLVIDSHGAARGGVITTDADKKNGVSGDHLQAYNLAPIEYKKQFGENYQQITSLKNIMSYLDAGSTCVFMTCALGKEKNGTKFMEQLSIMLLPANTTLYFNQDWSDPMNSNDANKKLQIWQGSYGISKGYLKLGWVKVVVNSLGAQRINIKTNSQTGDIYLDNREGKNTVTEMKKK